MKIKLFIVDKRLLLLTFIFTCANDSLFFTFLMVISGRGGGGWGSAGSFPEQRLVIEPNGYSDRYFDQNTGGPSSVCEFNR